MPTRANTFVSTLYRATYLYQYSASRGLLFVFAFSNRDNEFRYYNTVALYACAGAVLSRPYKSPAVISVSDNLLIVHYKEVKESYLIDLADVPFDAAGNISLPVVARNAISKLTVLPAFQLPAGMKDSLQDPSFALAEEDAVPYHSYEVQITSNSIGLELESAFQK